MPGEIHELLLRRHRGPSFHPGEDDRLALPGEGVLLVEDGGGGIGDAEVVVLLLEAVDRLLPEGRGAARRAAREESA